MAVLPVLRIGNPLLLACASEIKDFDTPELHQLIQDMLDTMAAENGAGLAAPQIGSSLRLVVFGFENNPRYPDAGPVPETILLNPVITTLDDTMENDWEGCLSLPGMRGLVPRHCNIEYSGFDPFGKPIKVKASGFHARVVQHECDHLDGILYPRRMPDLTYFGYVEELLESGQLTAQPCDN
jgi:peptide deformylase